MVFKLLEAAQKSWRRLDSHNQLPKLVLGVTFNDGIEVIVKPTVKPQPPPPDRPGRHQNLRAKATPSATAAAAFEGSMHVWVQTSQASLSASFPATALSRYPDPTAVRAVAGIGFHGSTQKNGALRDQLIVAGAEGLRYCAHLAKLH